MRLSRWVASGFGTGFAPVAPGTAGSLLGLAIGALLLALAPQGGARWAVAAGAVLASLGGIWAIHASAARDDPGWVVIDEIAGMLIALLALPRPSAAGLLAAFVLFRLFDIAKPGPVGWADRHHGAVAVMGDDVIAGGLAGLALWGITMLAPGWFA
jgi:phosphatidylglycerophosphatase A